MSQFPFSSLVGGYGLTAGSFVVRDEQDAPALESVRESEALQRATIPLNSPLDWGFFCGAPFNGDCCGYDPVPPLTPALAWRMRAYPAIALASNILVFAPILSSERSIDIVNDRGQKEMAEKIKLAATSALIPMLARAMPGACESLHFGNWLQELVWGRRDGRTDPVEVRPILPLEATIHEDGQRRFSRYEINGQFRTREYGFLAVNSPHLDPVRGYSRNQNAIADYWRALKSSDNADKIERKASGRQLMIGLPRGQSHFRTLPDGTKVPQTAEEIATAIANRANTGDPFVLPMWGFTKESIEKNPDLAKVPAVSVEQFDWGDNGAALLAHLERMNALDRNMIRAWFHGEREATEGQHGTKAEAESHKAGGVFDCELVHADIARQWDDQVMATWLRTNFGPEWVGCFKTKPAPLSDPMQEFLQGIVTSLIGSKDSETSLNLDERAILERTKTPVKPADQVEKDRKEMEAEQARQQKQPGMNGNGSNGIDPRVGKALLGTMRRGMRRING
jgi:hypothetical protein